MPTLNFVFLLLPKWQHVRGLYLPKSCSVLNDISITSTKKYPNYPFPPPPPNKHIPPSPLHFTPGTLHPTLHPPPTLHRIPGPHPAPYNPHPAPPASSPPHIHIRTFTHTSRTLVLTFTHAGDRGTVGVWLWHRQHLRGHWQVFFSFFFFLERVANGIDNTFEAIGNTISQRPVPKIFTI